MGLKEQNGWNQIPADWQRFLVMEPDGCFLAGWNSHAVGTAFTVVFEKVAWVAMVLVDEPFRKKGIGRELMEHILDYLEIKKVASIRLDATPLGRPVYEKLGFLPEYSLCRFAGNLPYGPVVDGVQGAGPSDFEDILGLDRQVTGTDRRKMFSCFFKEHADEIRIVRDGGTLLGFSYARPGSRAWQIGPILGESKAAQLLFADIVNRHGGRAVFLDIPEQNRLAQEWAQQAGLRIQRQLLRMGKGPRISENLQRFWAGSGPEKG
jgi:hypothetical protein